jgi:hypothetical protein
MTKEKTEVSVFCDCCSRELKDLGIRTNCGRFQEPYLKRTQDDIDLCYTCAGKIFYREVEKKVNTEKMQEWIRSLRKAESQNPLGEDLVECTFLESIVGVAKCSEQDIGLPVSNSLSSIDDPKSIKDL